MSLICPHCHDARLYTRRVYSDGCFFTEYTCYKCGETPQIPFVPEDENKLKCRFDRGDTGDTRYILAARNSEAVNRRRKRDICLTSVKRA